ncbi:homocysteine-responsive endoplasmic reticulum-resident ubiquitin-like domain member 2 protein isoform X1 [Crotalus tigris]|uniref:homocysteine-responsive endoplasmic reticulum-resident ubiquitin-like domain member 2 protein isoform X1 n=1 Tax=Crotalus tigris TaxID=88082 RepID=UPI00192FA578|nr:homocysteine-responsive endoplasmic reticulum-resident ubiquitin-like domain member 2 protein isoform X1 [Crotalus tigris]
METPVAGAPVTLIIKAPNQKYTDQTISCYLDWTVGRLKCHLSKVYPSKPSTKDQRLVYSGRLLPDHLQLRDILRKQDEYHMVHLVCSSRTPPNSPKPDTIRESHESSASSNSLSSEHLGLSSPSPAQETVYTAVSNSEGVRHRNFAQTHNYQIQSHPFSYILQSVDNQFPGQGISTGFPVYPTFSPLQMLWWQQMYARQYYMQYQAAVSAQAILSPDSTSPPVPEPSSSDHVPANEAPAAPNVAPQENRPINQNVQMNAQGGPVINEEDFNRDWLDWIYTFSRAAILLSIVYFYSSFSRFVMVMGAMLLVYLDISLPKQRIRMTTDGTKISGTATSVFLLASPLNFLVGNWQHQAGWFPFRQEGFQQPAANNADINHDGQNVNNAGLEEMERLMDEGIEEDSGEDIGDVSAEQNPGFMSSAWSFITTFFTSLIPEGPPQVGN